MQAAHEKSNAPTVVWIFQGLELDTDHRTIRIPQLKIKQFAEALSELLARKKVTLKQMQWHLS